MFGGESQSRWAGLIDTATERCAPFATRTHPATTMLEFVFYHRGFCLPTYPPTGHLSFPDSYVSTQLNTTQVLLDWSQKVSASAASRKSVNVKASTAPVTPLTTQSGQQQQQQRPPGLSEAASPASTPSRPVSFGGPATGGLIRPPLPASSSSTPSLLSLLPAPSPSPPATPSVAAPAGHVVGVPASAALPAPLAGGGAMAGGGVGGGAEALGAAAAGGSEGNGGVDNNIDNNDNGANPGLLLPAPGSSVMPQRGPGKGVP